MFKNFKFISMAVSFVLLIQLNAFALSGETSEKQSDAELISGKGLQSELVSMTSSTPSAIPTATPSDDYGDTIEDAAEIEVGNNVKGAINTLQDIDYFCFTPKESGTYQINFTHDFYNAAILSINENPIIEYNSNYFFFSENTKYYIKIWNEESSYSLYEFSIKLIKDDYGDTFSDSHAIKSDIIYGSIYNYSDNDVFSFTATDKSYHIHSVQLPSENITLYNKSYELIDKTNSSDENYGTYNWIFQKPVRYVSSNVFYDNLTIGDTYYLKVEGNIKPVEYSISLSAFEDDYGNTYDSAQIITANTLVNGKIEYFTGSYNDIDVFTFIPKTSGIYCIDSSLPIKSFVRYSIPLENNIKLEKFDDNSKAILLSPSIDESYRLNFDLIKGEKYFLTIQYTQRSNYCFTVNGPLSSPTPSPALTPRAEMKRGDINDDGDINAVDFALYRLLLLGKSEIPSDSFSIYRADINSDNQIDSIDFGLLRKYLLGIIDRL